MSILVDQATRVLIQGITGKEGIRACKEMLSYGTRVLAGVTPGKGGEAVEGIPVYNTIAEAKKNHPEINTSLIVVPSQAVKDAAWEAIWAGIPLINILTEHVPVRDCATIISFAKSHGVRIVGPSSVGIISPGKAKLGSIGSSAVEKEVFSPGAVGIISKSGGMTSEIALTLTKAGFGQSTAVGIGGDFLIGSDFSDLLKLFANDPETKAVVLFGEIGGTYEEQAAELIKNGGIRKPVIAFVAGKFSESLPEESILGHAGAIVSRGRGSYTSKINAFKKAGVLLASELEEVPLLLKSVL